MNINVVVYHLTIYFNYIFFIPVTEYVSVGMFTFFKFFKHGKPLRRNRFLDHRFYTLVSGYDLRRIAQLSALIKENTPA